MKASPAWVHIMLLALGIGCSAGVFAEPRDGREKERLRMVREQIEARGVKDGRVLEAMREIPRHLFVPERYGRQAYGDHPLPIGHDQTISQPFIVAYMTEALALRGEERVLEIGTGSGYQAAVLSRMAREVFSVEILQPLADESRERLERMGYHNVEVRCGDGYLGWPEKAPFDAIMVTAAPPQVPQALVEQLELGGRMVLPVGVGTQDLLRITKTPDGLKEEILLPVRFVPMVPGKKAR
jgi:protein-L-isoaspartate(D-aspartate) O-methyltransferase